MSKLLEMNPEVKAAWLARLRSGEIKQGAEVLYQVVDDVPHLCCLGVLCELAVEAGVVTRVESHGSYGYVPTRDDEVRNVETVVLPVVVAHWAGLFHPLDGQEPVYEINPEIAGRELSVWNDGDSSIFDDDDDDETELASVSFAEIADLIEEYL